MLYTNRRFSSYSGPLYQNEVKCSAFDTELRIFIFMQIKLIFTRKVVHLASFWRFVSDLLGLLTWNKALAGTIHIWLGIVSGKQII